MTIEDVRRVARQLPRSYEVLVSSEPEVFLMPRRSDLRFNWVEVRLEALDVERMREIVVDAWRLVVPKSVALASTGD